MLPEGATLQEYAYALAYVGAPVGRRQHGVAIFARILEGMNDKFAPKTFKLSQLKCWLSLHLKEPEEGRDRDLGRRLERSGMKCYYPDWMTRELYNVVNKYRYERHGLYDLPKAFLNSAYKRKRASDRSTSPESGVDRDNQTNSEPERELVVKLRVPAMNADADAEEHNTRHTRPRLPSLGHATAHNSSTENEAFHTPTEEIAHISHDPEPQRKKRLEVPKVPRGPGRPPKKRKLEPQRSRSEMLVPTDETKNIAQSKTPQAKRARTRMSKSPSAIVIPRQDPSLALKRSARSQPNLTNSGRPPDRLSSRASTASEDSVFGHASVYSRNERELSAMHMTKKPVHSETLQVPHPPARIARSRPADIPEEHTFARTDEFEEEHVKRETEETTQEPAEVGLEGFLEDELQEETRVAVESESKLLQAKCARLEIENACLKNENLSLKDQLAHWPQKLQEEHERTRSFERAFMQRHGEDLGREFVYLNKRDREASSLRATMKALFGVFNGDTFPPSPSIVDLNADWENISQDIKRICSSRKDLCPKISSAQIPERLWSEIEPRLFKKGESQILKKRFDKFARRITNWCMIRALTGLLVCCWVFDSSFPHFLNGSPREREKVYSLIALKDGPIAVQRMNLAVGRLLFNEDSFRTHEIPNKAAEWTALLRESFEACFSVSVQDTSGQFWGDSPGRNARSVKDLIQTCFQQAINLKITLQLSPLNLRYRVQFFHEESEFDGAYMEAQDESGGPCTVESWMRVKLCLFPALLQIESDLFPEGTGPEYIASTAIYGQKTYTTSDEEGLKEAVVVAKAIVLLDNESGREAFVK